MLEYGLGKILKDCLYFLQEIEGGPQISGQQGHPAPRPRQQAGPPDRPQCARHRGGSW